MHHCQSHAAQPASRGPASRSRPPGYARRVTAESPGSACARPGAVRRQAVVPVLAEGGGRDQPSPAVPAAATAACYRGLQPLPSRALLTALAGGVALAAAFPPAGWWPLAAAGPALLVLALWRQRLRMALATGAVFGLAFFFPLAVPLAGQPGLVRLGCARRRRDRHLHGAGRRAVAVAAAAARGRWRYGPIGRVTWPRRSAAAGHWEGFPWGRLGDEPGNLARGPLGTAIGGPAFLTFLLALTGTCVAWLVLGSPARMTGPGDSGGQQAVCQIAAVATALVLAHRA